MRTQMSVARQFGTVTAISTILAGVLVLVASVLAISAVGVDVDLLAEPADLITLGADGADVFRWAWLLDLFGYYVLIVPVILYLRHRLEARSPMLIQAYTTVGIGYVTVGAIGLVIMVAALPPMMTAWSGVTEAEQASLEKMFKVLTDVTFFGVSPLAFVLGGIWWLGVGSLIRTEEPLLGLVTVVLGGATLASGLGFLFQVDLIARLELLNYLLTPVWAFWIGIVAARRRDDRVTTVA